MNLLGFIIAVGLTLAHAIPLPRLDGDSADIALSAEPEFPNHRPRVVVFVSSKCPCSKAHEIVLNQLADRFVERVDFFAVVAGDEPEAKDHFLNGRLRFPVLNDRRHVLADALGARATPHVFVHHRGKLVYQGGVDSSHDPARAQERYLEPVLAALIQGLPSPFSEKRSLGCVIKR